MRKLPEMGEEVAADIERAWEKPQEEWARKRLMVFRLIAQHGLTVAQAGDDEEVEDGGHVGRRRDDR